MVIQSVSRFWSLNAERPVDGGLLIPVAGVAAIAGGNVLHSRAFNSGRAPNKSVAMTEP